MNSRGPIVALYISRKYYGGVIRDTVAEPRGQGNHAPPPGPVKIRHKKMATERGRIDFIFLGPLPLTQRRIRYWDNNPESFFTEFNDLRSTL